MQIGFTPSLVPKAVLWPRRRCIFYRKKNLLRARMNEVWEEFLSDWCVTCMAADKHNKLASESKRIQETKMDLSSSRWFIRRGGRLAVHSLLVNAEKSYWINSKSGCRYLPFPDWFGTKWTSVWCQINRKMVYTIWFWFDLIRFRKYFSVRTSFH